jgi:serine/threonine protein kinase
MADQPRETASGRTVYPSRHDSRYVLLRPLDLRKGSSLHVAIDEQTERLCVLKETPGRENSFTFYPQAATGALHHENLVSIYDFKDRQYVVMELIAGRSLMATWNRCAEKKIGFPVELSAYWIVSLCRGLSRLHDAGFVHRVVCPDNLMLSEDGEAKLGGFSVVLPEGQQRNEYVGVLPYASPEQLTLEDVNRRTDVFAAGVILWELLTGVQMFPGAEMRPRDTTAVDPPSRRNPHLPAALDRVVMRAIRQRPEFRFATADEMAGALEPFAIADGGAAGRDFLRSLFVDEILQEDRENRALAAAYARKIPAFTRPPPASGEPLLGTTLEGRWRLERLVGTRANSRLYECTHTTTKSRWLATVFGPYLTQADKDRLFQETRASHNVKHSNVETYVDYGLTGDDQPYLVAPFPAGVPLQQLVTESNGRLPIGHALEIANEVCQAMLAAHRRGVTHGCLDPSNVFSEYADPLDVRLFRVKVCEFGVGRLNKSAFQAPEQRQPFGRSGYRADIYAIGALINYLTTARQPGDPPTGRSMNLQQDLPSLFAAMTSCLSADPQKRPPDVSHVMEVIRASLRQAGALVAFDQHASSSTSNPASRETASPTRRSIRSRELLGAAGRSIRGISRTLASLDRVPGVVAGGVGFMASAAILTPLAVGKRPWPMLVAGGCVAAASYWLSSRAQLLAAPEAGSVQEKSQNAGGQHSGDQTEGEVVPRRSAQPLSPGFTVAASEAHRLEHDPHQRLT